MKPYYLTTAIDYANGAPHLGHAYEKVLADVVARSRRMMGRPVHFLTGLDEHGQKVQQTAAKQGLSPQAFVDGIAPLFHQLCARLEISHDDFIRTTEARHQGRVRAVLQQLYDQGDIYLAEYSGYYSVRQEQFVLEKDKVDGQWPELYGEVVSLTEKNYFFRLARHQEWLREHLRTHEDFIFPRFRAADVLNFLKEPVNDLCISRPKERLAWGIPLPFDEGYVTYVWFDALLNYYTAVADSGQWPADLHIIGKDILVPAHAVYWPVMLHAAGLPLPKSLLVHGWWLRGGRKESKSSGVALNPLDLAEKYGADAFRYYVIREMNVGQDSEFTEDGFVQRYTGDLGNDLGNLVSRGLNMLHSYAGGVVPATTVDEAPEQDLRAAWERVRTDLRPLYDGFQFHLALDRVWTFIRAANRYLEVRQPWKTAKLPGEAAQAQVATALASTAEALRLASLAFAPVMPGLAAKIHGLIGAGPVPLWSDETLAWSGRLAGAAAGPKTILFPRKDA